MIFINNKYSSTYFRIINRAKIRFLEGYTERHHIIPKSLGGLNEPSNLVPLTSKEHYIVHLLLPKMVIDSKHKQKMYAALMCMTKMQWTTHQRYINIGSSRFYEEARKQVRFDYMKGRRHSLETRKKMSEKQKGRRCSDQTRSRIGDANRGRILPPVSDETKRKLALAGNGRKLSAESRLKISESLSGKKVGYKWWHNGTQTKVSAERPGEGWFPGRSPKSNL